MIENAPGIILKYGTAWANVEASKVTSAAMATMEPCMCAHLQVNTGSQHGAATQHVVQGSLPKKASTVQTQSCPKPWKWQLNLGSFRTTVTQQPASQHKYSRLAADFAKCHTCKQYVKTPEAVGTMPYRKPAVERSVSPGESTSSCEVFNARVRTQQGVARAQRFHSEARLQHVPQASARSAAQGS